MTERERWIVYPLLFLALGAALRDKLAKQTRTKDIVCERIILVDDELRQQAVLTGQALLFDLAGEGNGYVRANVVEAHHLSQLGQRVLSLPPQAGISLQQLMQLLPQQLRVIPGLPPGPATPQDAVPPTDAGPAGQVPAPSGEQPTAPASPAGGGDSSAAAEPAPAS